ncbi:response regulator transcription factor [Chitinophaga pinensis]|uniref:Two component transcriptional regulator, LuxR family n=1 Tax=Chitinophaga pinensis (strain ATCC 43595 / DSM 2588 / LMG 13176 / NBRC 15968 / NCIMB 11800 / UQM 2034) TaxID=485918 RepID=A0A979G497_CHIPD|nr:response regulator transcription factor [Chitinophaga pinensis]ACU60386.1 two component transcriptional regulator, LuxR family [Chitinophaga pinensis DSM 2588]
MNHDIRLVIADDHEIFRDGLALMLSRQPDITLVGQANNGRELLELLTSVEADVVMTDLKMPLMDGITATRALLQRNPDIKIIALSMFDEEELIVEMLEAGAKGYLLKNADKQEIIEAINSVYEDHIFYCRQTSARLAAMIVKSRFNPPRENNAVTFTDREKEIIRLICQQFTAQEIGDKIFLSKRTVEGHRTRILEKMNVKNTAGVVVFALKNNLISEAELL